MLQKILTRVGGWNFGLEEGNTPIFSQTQAQNAPPGTLVSTLAGDVFENAGDNPRFYQLVGFSPTEYINEDDSRIAGGRVFVRVKTAAGLSSLSSPPASPFTVNADVWMTNDMGCKTRTTTLAYTTSYAKVVVPSQSAPYRQNAPPGTLVSSPASEVFDNAGTDPEFTHVEFSPTEYIVEEDSGLFGDNNRVFVRPKTVAELNAMEPLPPNPFIVTATVKMTNDEGATATGTIEYRTGYR